MDIVLYITALLESQKAVGIAGLGTLYKKKIPGKYDVALHAFVPPTFELQFTTEIRNEHELVHYIGSQRNITSESANYFVGEFAEKIMAQLTDTGEADLGTLGSLKRTDEGISLVSAGGANFGNEFFGLPTVEEIKQEVEEHQPEVSVEQEKLEEIVDENKLEEENPGQEHFEASLTDDQPVYDEIEEVNFEHPTKTYWDQPTPADIAHQEEILSSPLNHDVIGETENAGLVGQSQIEESLAAGEAADDEKPGLISPVAQADATVAANTTTTFDEKSWAKNIAHPNANARRYVDDDEEDQLAPSRSRSIFFKILFILFFVALAGAILYLFFPHFFDQYIQRNAQRDTVQQAQVPFIDSAKVKQDSLRKDSLAKMEAADNAIRSNAVDTTQKYYEVIGTSEDTKAAADRYIERVAKKGITAKHIKLSKLRYNVSLGTFGDQKEASKFADSMKVLLKNKQIYAKQINPKKHTK